MHGCRRNEYVSSTFLFLMTNSIYEPQEEKGKPRSFHLAPGFVLARNKKPRLVKDRGFEKSVSVVLTEVDRRRAGIRF